MKCLSRVVTVGMTLILFTVVFSCAPANLYTITMTYLPSETSAPEIRKGEQSITVAGFIDGRNVDDTMRLGTVIHSNGTSIPVLPKYRRAADVVTDGIKTCISAQGYPHSLQSPSWDLERDSIDTGWGNLLIGGSIDRLEVICRKDSIRKSYQADVTLTIVFADVRNKRIIRTMEATATSSLTHIRFSEGLLGEQISETLTQAIRQVCADGKTIREMIERVND